MNSKGKIRDLTDLNAWKEAHKLALATYQETEQFPHTERFSLVDQMRRASVSITSNIAEGFSRNSRKEKVFNQSVIVHKLLNGLIRATRIMQDHSHNS